MKLLDVLYTWIAGSKAEFANQFRNNDALYSQALAFWNKLSGTFLWLFIVLLLVCFMAAYIYFGPYNNRPGRHYKPTHWCGALVINFVIILIGSFLIEYFIADPRLDGAMVLEIKIALINAFYSLLLYLLFSWIWRKYFPTNAYRCLW